MLSITFGKPSLDLRGIRLRAGVLVGLLATVVTLHAAAPAPRVARPIDSAPVTVRETDGSFILANGLLTARIDKRRGELEELVYRGADVLGHDQGRVGGWEQDPSAAEKVGGLTRSLTINPATNGGERAEISIKGVTKGDRSAGLTPGSPGAPAFGTVNCDLEIRYTLARGQSGLHVYAIFSHPPEYGPLNLPESRYILRLNQAFDWLSVDADRNLLMCAPRDWGNGVVVHAKEQRILSQGVYKNSVEHKYSYTAVQYKIPAYGWSSTKRRVGVWFINPSIEYLSGGATKQELVCHFGDNSNPDPIILNYWRGTHYGGGATASLAAGERWSKVIGPMLIYLNALDEFQTPTTSDLDTLAATSGNPTVPSAWHTNATALWLDALAQAKKENATWPCDWVHGVDYPRRHERGNVTGRIVLNDPQATSKKLPHLTVGLAYPHSPLTQENATPDNAPNAPGGRGGFARRPMHWTRDAKNYQFWNDGDEDGRFTITQVRPGRFTLHAFADGVLGEFARADVAVEAGKTLDLGELVWKPVRRGRQLWEIGYPDRTGGEFYKGDGSNYWLWGWGLRYPLLFPNDITYTIGKSDYRRDWFFQHTPHGESRAWLNPAARDPAHQRFGWVKAESLQEYPQTNQRGPWATYGRGRACTWSIQFDITKPATGTATLRIALAGADTPALAIAVNGREAGVIRPFITNALRYNTNKGVYQELMLRFDAARLHVGENKIELTVAAGDLTTGVVYDYLRLELDETAKFTGTGE